MTAIFRLSDWERHQIKQRFYAVTRFIATVILSAVCAVALEHEYPKLKHRWLSTHSVRKLLSYEPTHAGLAPSRPRTLGDHYSHYLDEALPLLRADVNVRLVKLELPGGVLTYQQGTALRGPGAMVWLQAAGSKIPVLAVSRGAREFLSAMRITFIDPNSVPDDLFKGALPLSQRALRANYLLVPDASGSGARYFTVSKR